MSAAQRWALWISLAASAASGLAYAAMRYLLPHDDPFSAYNHPAQPYALAAHVLVSPALLFVLGWIFGGHALVKAGDAVVPGRRTGWTVLGVGAPLVLSGYLLQTAAASPLRPAIAWSHGIAGAVLLATAVGHALGARRRRAAAAAIPARDTVPDRQLTAP